MKENKSRLLENSVPAVIVKDVNSSLEKIALADTFEDALNMVAQHSRLLLGTHQAAVSYLPNADFRSAIHAISLSSKYKKYNSYDVMPNGDGLWGCVRQEGKVMRLTEKEIYSHPRFKNFSGLKDARGLEHPPLLGWLAAPIMKGKRFFGVVQLSDKIEEEFSKEDEKTLLHITQFIYSIFAMHHFQHELDLSTKTVCDTNEALADRIMSVNCCKHLMKKKALKKTS